jgi:hypothetical protein
VRLSGLDCWAGGYAETVTSDGTGFGFIFAWRIHMSTLSSVASGCRQQVIVGWRSGIALTQAIVAYSSLAKGSGCQHDAGDFPKF